MLANRMDFDRMEWFLVINFQIITLDSVEEKSVDLLSTCLLSLMEMIKKEFSGKLYAATGRIRYH